MAHGDVSAILVLLRSSELVKILATEPTEKRGFCSGASIRHFPRAPGSCRTLTSVRTCSRAGNRFTYRKVAHEPFTGMPASDSSHIVTMVVVAVAVSAASILGGLFLWKKAGSTHSGTEVDLAKVPAQIVHVSVFVNPDACARVLRPCIRRLSIHTTGRQTRSLRAAHART